MLSICNSRPRQGFGCSRAEFATSHRRPAHHRDKRPTKPKTYLPCFAAACPELASLAFILGRGFEMRPSRDRAGRPYRRYASLCTSRTGVDPTGRALCDLLSAEALIVRLCCNSELLGRETQDTRSRGHEVRLPSGGLDRKSRATAVTPHVSLGRVSSDNRAPHRPLCRKRSRRDR